MLRSHPITGTIVASVIVGLAAPLAISGQQPAPAPGQQPAPAPAQQRPAFRGGANFVYVDAYPRRDGRIVRDLTAADFRIIEDGKPQAIDVAEFIEVLPYAPDESRRDPRTIGEAARLAGDPRQRVFLIYLDSQHVRAEMRREGARAMRQPLREFLERSIGPDDLFGVMTSDMPLTQLTLGRRLEVTLSAIEDYWRVVTDDLPADHPRPRTPREQFLYACYINRTPQIAVNIGIVNNLFARHRLDATFESLRDVVRHFSLVRAARTNVLLFSGGWDLDPTPLQDKHLWRAIPEVGVTIDGTLAVGDGRADPPDKAACDAEYARLSSMDFRSRLPETIDAAARANVSITTVDPARLGAFDCMVASPGDESCPQPTVVARRLDALRTLSAGTAGRSIVSTNDIATPLRELADDLSAYYLLGYYSTNNATDGRFRKIDVSVRRPDVQVTARRGYFAPTAAMMKAAEAAGGATSAGDASVTEALDTLSRLRSDAELYVHGVASGEGLTVAAELPVARLASGAWADGGEVIVTVASPEGQSVGRQQGTLAAGSRAVVMRVALPSGSSGPWRVRVEVRGQRGVLGGAADVEARPAVLLGEPLAWRGTASRRIPLAPVARFEFPRSERIHIEVPVLAAIDSRSARLLDRNGRPLPVPVAVSEQDKATDGRVLTADLILASLAPGDYVIEITGGAGDRRERRLMAVRVGR